MGNFNVMFTEGIMAAMKNFPLKLFNTEATEILTWQNFSKNFKGDSLTSTLIV